MQHRVERGARWGDRTDVEYERLYVVHDPAKAAEARAWHIERLRAEGRLH